MLLTFALFSSESSEVQIYSKFDSKFFGSMFWTNWGSPSEQVRRHASRYLHIPVNTCARTHKHTGTHVIKCFWVPHRNPSKATPRGSRSMAAADTWVCGWGKRTGAGQFFCNPVWSSCWVHHCLSPGGALAPSITKWCHCHLIRFSGLEYRLEISPELTLNSAPAQNQTPAVEDLTELKWLVRCKPSLRC